MGGVVVASAVDQEGIYVGEHKVACVGDLVRYPDGSERPIVSGAGDIHMIDDEPVALVGSRAANGDHIVSSLQAAVELVFEAGDELPRGVLQPGFIPSDMASQV
jgi:uncharacterized Zn-binding protein involved in type VI secretion